MAIRNSVHNVHKRVFLQLVMAEVDFLLASVSQVLEATSIIWGRKPRPNVNRVRSGEWQRGGVGGQKWFRTIIGVYTWRRSQKAVDTAQTLIWMCIHWKLRREHTHTHTETEWIMSTHQSRDSLLSRQFNVSLFVDLRDIRLLRNEEQVWWMKKCLYNFALHVPTEAVTAGTNLPWWRKSVSMAPESWIHILSLRQADHIRPKTTW
jgi:hypothetical protein